MQGRPPSSPPRCLRCDLADPRRLYSVTLARSHRVAPNTWRKRTIPARLCAPCAAELLRAVERYRPPDPPPVNGVKRCVRCSQEQPTGAFPRSRTARDGLSSWCRECHAWSGRRWYARQKVAVVGPTP